MNFDYKKIWSEVITASLIIIISAIAIISFIIISEQDVEVYNPSSAVTVSSATDEIKEVLSLLQTKYMGEVDMEKLVEGAIEGMFSKIDDPYTRYLTEEQYLEEFKETGKEYVGIGVHISWSIKQNGLVIIGTMPESPAKEAGLQSGDVILSVNDIEVTKENYNERINDIKAEKADINTTVKIVIKRGEQDLSFDIPRRSVTPNYIEASVLDNNIGYIKILEFTSGIYEQFKQQYDDLIHNKKVSGLIIDLRNNPGGVVDDTIKIANLLVKDGLILKTVYSEGSVKRYNANSVSCPVPFTVLVNENSASASEILAGCVKDLKQGTVIGTTTFGKGVMQAVIELESGAGIAITTAKFYTASNSEIHGVGIEPDIVVELPEGVVPSLTLELKNDTQLKKAIEVLTN